MTQMLIKRSKKSHLNEKVDVFCPFLISFDQFQTFRLNPGPTIKNPAMDLSRIFD